MPTAYYRATLTGSGASTTDAIRPCFTLTSGTVRREWSKDGTVLVLVAADDATHATLTNTPGVHRCTSRDCTLSCAQSLGADSGWRPEGYAVGDGISPYREGGA